MPNDIIAEAFASMDEESGSKPESLPGAEETKAEEPAIQPEKAPEPAPEAKEVPFHRHPRWKAVQEQLKSERAEREKLASQLAEFQKGRQPEAAQPTASVPENMRVIFGENYQAYRVWAEEQRNIARAELAEWQKQQREQELSAKAAGEAFVSRAEESMREIGEENGVDLSDRDSTVRNQLLDIVEQYEMYDRDGNPNLRKAWALHAQLHPSTDAAEKADRKKVAANAAAPASAAPGTPDAEVMTRSRLKNKKFDDFFK